MNSPWTNSRKDPFLENINSKLSGTWNVTSYSIDYESSEGGGTHVSFEITGFDMKGHILRYPLTVYCDRYDKNTMECLVLQKISDFIIKMRTPKIDKLKMDIESDILDEIEPTIEKSKFPKKKITIKTDNKVLLLIN